MTGGETFAARAIRTPAGMPPPIGTQKSRKAPSMPAGQPCGRGALGSRTARQSSSDIQQTFCGAVPKGATSRPRGMPPRPGRGSTCAVELQHLLERRPVGRREADGQQARRHEAGGRRGLAPQTGFRLALLRGERVGRVVNDLPERVTASRQVAAAAGRTGCTAPVPDHPAASGEPCRCTMRR